MIGTYASALLIVLTAVPIGTAVMALSGRREFSWVAAAVGLAAITVIAWWTVRLPGEGLTALISILVLAAAALAFSLARVEGFTSAIADALPVAFAALVAVSVPFAAEGHFGVLGTGFNVDMSQHLFTASWLANPLGPAPELVKQGYPLGPHALAVAAAKLSGGELVAAFSGITIAVPVLGALTALAALERLGRLRRLIAALLVALPYLVASYLAQGSFKELFEAVLLLGFAIWLLKAETWRRPFGPLVALPAAVLGAGTLYVYSGPGLGWIVGTLGLWAIAGLWRHRTDLAATVRAVAAPVLVAVLAVVVLAAPELDRISDFGGNAGSVADAGDAEAAIAAPHAASGSSDAASGAGEDSSGASADQGQGADGGDPARRGLNLFDDDLGNLFGQITPLEALDVWPSGDFRVEPGDGTIPAAAFYLGALLGALAIGVGLVRSLRRGETALAATLVAALVIWLAARAVSTPYATAKALQMVAPIGMLIAVRELLDPAFIAPLRERPAPRRLARTALAVAFAAAAAASSLLVLANAPVGPANYTTGFTKLRDELAGEPVLILAPVGQLEDRHGAEFYGWELRGAKPICAAAFPEESGSFDGPVPPGIHYVLTIGDKDVAPFTDVTDVSKRYGVGLWANPEYRPETAPRVEIDPDVPTDCELGLPAA